jgi:hypothetical protein
MDDLTKEILAFILEELSVSRQQIPKLRELRRRLEQLDKPEEPLCPAI